MRETGDDVKARRYLTWIALIVVLLLLNMPERLSLGIKTGFRDVIAPFQTVTSGFGARLRESMGVLTGPGSRTAAAEKTQAELAALRERVRSLESLERKNSELEDLLAFAREARRELIACQVIARGEASGWWEAVVVNKGEAEGLANNMAVITPEGLVGRTRSVSKHTCDVLLITDRNCGVSARLERTGECGIVKGQGVTLSGDPVLDMRCPVDPCRIDYLAGNVPIRMGDKVVTSGLGGVFPEGLPIGTINRVDVHKSGLYQVGSIQPAAALGKLRYVFVIRRQPADAAEPAVARNGVAATNRGTRP